MKNFREFLDESLEQKDLNKNSVIDALKIYKEIESSKGFVVHWTAKTGKNIENVSPNSILKTSNFTDGFLKKELGFLPTDLDKTSDEQKRDKIIELFYKSTDKLKDDIKKHLENIKSKRKNLLSMLKNVDFDNLENEVKFIYASYKKIISDNDFEILETYIKENRESIEKGDLKKEDFYNSLKEKGMSSAYAIRDMTKFKIEDIENEAKSSTRKFTFSDGAVGVYSFFPKHIFGRDSEKGMDL